MRGGHDPAFKSRVVLLELEEGEVGLRMRDNDARLVVEDFFNKFEGLGTGHGRMGRNYQRSLAVSHAIIHLYSCAGQLFIGLEQLRYAAVYGGGAWRVPRLRLIG